MKTSIHLVLKDRLKEWQIEADIMLQKKKKAECPSLIQHFNITCVQVYKH